ncbi:two-component system response regulator YesN [Hydrogenispora ethanolica]|uniref:Two-component system response regulator YesN n=1 Tax=Hydrogenispora ethanolica TaxID=1082276 RepID=A0A4R1S671_HYDET|nr:helix-turn-helix domain-containing protein [Hydrogenispora ethanolica]TCL74290.1 two-component system response regulator YesN [Hydrogenispora ethanolica]
MYQVMIVDDEPSALDELALYINRVGPEFHVTAKAQGAEDALFSLEMTSPDLVITDIRMPVTDGLTLLQQIRETGWEGFAAIVTGYEDFSYAQQAMRLGVFEYILKPVFSDDIQALLQRTKQLLDNEQMKKDKLRDEIQAELYHQSLEGNGDCHIPSYLGQAKAFIKEHFAEPLSLSKIAKQVAVNPAYLSYSFTKYCGQNFLEYLTQYRIAKAKELLIQTSFQIQEVAHQIGYTDISYFTRVFRRETGLTPGGFRSLHRKQQ